MAEKTASKKIIDDIKEKINMGVWSVNQALPSENELGTKYDVSRGTVQKALLELNYEKFIFSVPGKGYYVAKTSFNNYKFCFSDLKGLDTKLLGINLITPPPEVIYNLITPPNKRVVKIERLGYDRDIPVAYEVKYIPYNPGAPLMEGKMDFSDFYYLVSNVVSSYEVSKKLDITGIKCPKEISDRIDAAEGEIISVAEQKIMDESGKCIGWGKSYYKVGYLTIDADRKY